MQSLGLQEEYRAEDSALKKFVQKLAATAFCPPAFMRLAWQGTQQEAPTMDHVDDLVTYFDRTWVNGNYKLSQWNYYDFEEPRTNNHIEGWHTRLKKIVGKADPNIFEVFEVMKKEQASSEMKLEQLELGGRAPPRKKRFIEKDKRISALFERFKEGQYSLRDYLDAIKYQTGL